MLDVDGTLAPVCEHWDQATVPEATREIVAELARHCGMVAFVSGRPLVDLGRMTGRDDLPAAGNHGLELRRAGEAGGPLPEVAAHLPALAALIARWAPRFHEEGILVEDKGATVSFHYRTCPDPERAARLLMDEVAADARAAGLRPSPGRMVLEVRPPVDADKGTAVTELLGDRPELSHAIFFGDDVTDADAWRALARMADNGRLDLSMAVLAISAETAPGLDERADVIVDGTDGVAAALMLLARE